MRAALRRGHLLMAVVLALGIALPISFANSASGTKNPLCPWREIRANQAAPACLFHTAQGPEPSGRTPKKDVPILQSWGGEYPVDQLGRLPAGQQTEGMGYIINSAAFAAVWQHLKPGEATPGIDFDENIVVFSRNVNFYNRITIAKAMLENGTLEVLTIETRSALPIEDNVAMALAVVPRAGVDFIQAGAQQIPLPSKEYAADPLNATYTIGNQKIALANGRREAEAAPGSTIKIRTSVLGTPVRGDLDDDGRDDAAVVLVHDAGGSGTFYYSAAAINENGTYHGTNGVLLGDRIEIKHQTIKNGLIVVTYADRKPDEPMSAPPSVETIRPLILKDGTLAALPPLEDREQVLEGLVTIGHEVRLFRPCSGQKPLWLLGNSPALNQIKAAYHQALPNPKPYTPVFMILVGRYAEAPTDGFGGEYEQAFFATEFVRVSLNHPGNL